MTGNQYPSAIHVNAFLHDSDNSNCTGIAYYFEQNRTINYHYLPAHQGGYGTYAPISTSPDENGVYVPATFNTYNSNGSINNTGLFSGLSIQRKYAPIGQGFMIKGKNNSTPSNVTLKNNHRISYKESGYNSFKNSITNLIENLTSVIRINTIINKKFSKQIDLDLTTLAANGIDRGIDAISTVEDSAPNDIYFVQNQEKYVIQGLVLTSIKKFLLELNRLVIYLLNLILL